MRTCYVGTVGFRGHPVMRRPVLALIVSILTGSLPAAAQHTEKLAIPSLTLTNEQFLAADATAGIPVTLTGRLHLPGEDPSYPVVVLLHGSGGPNAEAPYNWESFLPTLGVATLLLDSYTTRGVFIHSSNPSQL